MEANTLKRFNYCDQFTQAHGISIKTLMKKKKKCLIDIFFFRSDPNLSSFQTIRNIFIHIFYYFIHYETVSIIQSVLGPSVRRSDSKSVAKASHFAKKKAFLPDNIICKYKTFLNIFPPSCT